MEFIRELNKMKHIHFKAYSQAHSKQQIDLRAVGSDHVRAENKATPCTISAEDKR